MEKQFADKKVMRTEDDHRLSFFCTVLTSSFRFISVQFFQARLLLTKWDLLRAYHFKIDGRYLLCDHFRYVFRFDNVQFSSFVMQSQ